MVPIFPSGAAWSQCVGANAVLLLPASLSSASLLPPLAAFGSAVSQAQCALRTELERLGITESWQMANKKQTPFGVCLLFGIRQLPIFPSRLQLSIFGV